MTEEVQVDGISRQETIAPVVAAPDTAAPETVVAEAAAADAAASSEEYDPSKVEWLQNAEHIRHRPGMYIGDTSTNGLHHLVYELVYNAVDEALAGFCQNINVKINVDGSLSVGDDGRGIPVDIHPKTGRSTLEMIMTLTGTGAKFDKRTYKTSAGLHGMGAKAVTALSEWTEAEVRKGGKVYVQEYERGKPITEVKEMGAAKRTGTKITFKPDPMIFREAKFNYDTLERRLRELAFLNKGVTIKLTDEGTGQEDIFKADGGIAEFVSYINRDETPLHDIIYMDSTLDNVRVELAIQYIAADEERIRCYTNNAYNPVGGTHLSGFRSALTRALNQYGNKGNFFKNVSPIGDDFREGITALISVQVPDPQFESNNKLRLNNPEVEGIVTSVVNEHLSVYLEENPKDAQKIMKKVTVAAEAREAAAKARKQLKDRKSILSGGGLPGKLMDCNSRNRDESELFLVEGQSAGGSAESGRDRDYQAILPLRGKVLNVEKARVEKVLGNEELRSLISAVGVDIGETEDVSERRYGKVILLTDADVDGQHIRTLLLTFFYRQMRKLIEEGHVYVARPPLYKVTEKKKARFVQTIEEMNEELMRRGLDGTRLKIVPVVDPTTGVQGQPIEQAAEKLAGLVDVLGEIEGPLLILERRGVNLNTFLQKVGDQGLPTFRVLLAGREHWFHSQAEIDRFREEQKTKLGHELEVGDEMSGSGNGNGKPGETMFVQELHEVKAVNRGLARMKDFGLGADDLLPLPRIAGREPPQRFHVFAGDNESTLPHLRDLPIKIRKIGERGLSIMRFKGLGEMDAEELWETTLDPQKRILIQVRLDDALQAEDMFRTLMGEKVEPRRDFIQKHALDVTDIDYHGA